MIIPYIGRTGTLLTGLGTLLILVGVGSLVAAKMGNSQSGGASVSLPILAICGVGALFLLLAIVSVVFSVLDLDDRKQALALPEGSIRAFIALSLLVLFAILAIFLFDSMASWHRVEQRMFINSDLRANYIRENPGMVTGLSELIAHDGKTVSFYIAEVPVPLPAPAVDVGKQLLTIIGTLVTAVSGFYFGAQSTSKALSAFYRTRSGDDDEPSPQKIDPQAVVLADIKKNMTAIKVSGANLNNVLKVHLSTASASDKPLVATDIHSNDFEVTFRVDEPSTGLTANKWTVTLLDRQDRPIKVPGELLVTG